MCHASLLKRCGTRDLSTMDFSSHSYDVFLSYNSRDYQPVERIGRWLKDQQLSCFMDRWYLVPGMSWPLALEQVLSRSKAADIFLGPGEMECSPETTVAISNSRFLPNTTPLTICFGPRSLPSVKLGYIVESIPRSL
jgi:hypothetical protein